MRKHYNRTNKNFDIVMQLLDDSIIKEAEAAEDAKQAAVEDAKQAAVEDVLNDEYERQYWASVEREMIEDDRLWDTLGDDLAMLEEVEAIGETYHEFPLFF